MERSLPNLQGRGTQRQQFLAWQGSDICWQGSAGLNVYQAGVDQLRTCIHAVTRLGQACPTEHIWPGSREHTFHKPAHAYLVAILHGHPRIHKRPNARGIVILGLREDGFRPKRKGCTPGRSHAATAWEIPSPRPAAARLEHAGLWHVLDAPFSGGSGNDGSQGVPTPRLR